MTAQTLDPAESALELPKSEWTTPVLEVARMGAATRGYTPPPQDDQDGDGIPDACEDDTFPDFPGGPCDNLS